jgi:arginine decarboxylase
VRIVVTRGTGEGPTSLAAFDAALLAAGVENYNLIRLSSVIPPDAEIERGTFVSDPDEYGQRLYIVMAEQRATVPGTGAYAGVGWVQEPEDGRGLFVECEGETHAEVHDEIVATLDSMTAARGHGYDYGPVESEITGIECSGRPVAAVVIAVYKSEPWG